MKKYTSAFNKDGEKRITKTANKMDDKMSIGGGRLPLNPPMFLCRRILLVIIARRRRIHA